jgi:hypothetical protein
LVDFHYFRESPTPKSMRVFTIFALYFAIISTIFGQSSILTIGSTVEGSGGSISFSSGQIVYTCLESADYSLSQGVQQAYEVSIRTDTKQLPEWVNNIQVYPNPVNHQLFISLDQLNLPALSYSIYNVNGELIQKGNMHSLFHTINLSAWPSSIYILHIQAEDGSQYSFNLVKK